MEAVSEETSESKVSIEELESLLFEIDRTGHVEKESIGDPGEFLLRIYTIWQKKGGLKERKKNRNSQNQLRKLLANSRKIRSLQYKLQGIKPLSAIDYRNFIITLLQNWEYKGEFDEEGEPIYDSIKIDNISKLVDNIQSYIFIDRDDIKISGSKEYIDSENNIQIMQKRIISEIYNDSRALYVLSTNNTIIGSEPAISSAGFNRFISMYFEEDKKRNEFFEPLHIWIVDMGPRIDGDVASLEAFSNVCVLASKLATFSTFDGLAGNVAYEQSNIFERMTRVDLSIRRARWSWLSRKSVVLVRNLREEEILSLNTRFRFSGEIHRVPNVLENNVLPASTPNSWIDPLRSLYGNDFKIEDATLSVALRKSHGEANEPVEYQAHARIAKYRNSEDAVVKSIKLPSPGDSYETAMRLVFQAAKCVLRKDIHQRSEREETALRYLNLLGFHAMRIDQFVRTVMAVPSDDID